MVVIAIVCMLFFTALAGPALAQDGNNQGNDDQGGDNQGNQGNNKFTVPEIDPSSAISAIALLTGGVLLLAYRRRVKKQLP
jgi:hypothetical protein